MEAERKRIDGNDSLKLAPPAALLCALALVLVAAAASAGLFWDAGGASFSLPTARGETATYAGTGLYRLDPLSVAREGRVWDAANLFLALPLSVLALVFSLRGSLRGRLALLGLLAYWFYAYFQYAALLAFNPAFPLYVGIFGLCGPAFGLCLSGLDPAAVAARTGPRFPRRLFTGFCWVLAAALLLMWGARIAALTATGRFGPELAGLSTLTTQAFDLGLVVPLYVCTALLLSRRRPLGFLLCGVSLTYGALMCVVIPAWIAGPLLTRGELNAMEALPFLGICLVGLYLAWAFFSNLDEAGPDAVARASASARPDAGGA